MSDHDDVNKPKHYDLFPNQQVIDVIEAYLTEEEFAGYCKGNALKYRIRAGDKGDAIKCIAKANWHQNKLREVEAACEERNGGWTPGAIEAAAFRKSCDSAEVEWPDESRIDVIGKNGNDGAVYSEYTLDEVVGDAVLSDWAVVVAVDADGEVWEYSHDVESASNGWRNYDGWCKNINKVVPPFNFKNCIWEVNK